MMVVTPKYNGAVLMYIFNITLKPGASVGVKNMIILRCTVRQ